MNRARLVHGLWRTLSLPSEVSFGRALRAPERTQDALLKQTLKRQAGTRFGLRHDFQGMHSRADFRRRVPLTRYDDYADDIAAIRRGEPNVLTADAVQRLVPSSGSSSAVKLIPYTRGLGQQMQAAIAPWIVDLMRRHPSTQSGAAYWSVSPAFATADLPSVVPIGFDSDASYLGNLLAPLLEQVLVVPESLRHAQDLTAFQYASLRLLLACDNLRLISVWHPSFLTLLWEQRKAHWDRLLGDIAQGTLSPPRPLGESVEPCLRRRLKPQPQRARALAGLGAACSLEAVWPALSLVSAWGDGAAAGPFQELGRLVRKATLEPKGLLATEACVTIPYAGQYPLAIRSHFFEFLDEDGHLCEVDQLREGPSYEIVVTTLGGLYRYRLGDRVRVEGKLGCTPSLRFVGRADSTVDLTGEKLCEAFVQAAIRKAFGDRQAPGFAMLAPDHRDRTPAYTLYVDQAIPQPETLVARLECALSENPHFAYARALGQLGATRVCEVSERASTQYIERLHRGGARLGNIKPSALSRHDDWSVVLSGRYPSLHKSPPHSPRQTGQPY